MSLVWQLNAFVLYAEIAVFLFLCIPFPTALRARIAKGIGNSTILKQSVFYLQMLFFVILVQFISSVREMIKYQNEHENRDHHVDNIQTDTHLHMKMFRSQRNVYISGFSLFLLLVMNRFYALICELGTAEAVKKQAEGTAKEYDRLLDEVVKSKEKMKELVDESDKNEELAKKYKLDLEMTKKQAENLSTEYMRVTDQLTLAEKKLDIAKANLMDNSSTAVLGTTSSPAEAALQQRSNTANYVSKKDD
eukprot:Nk52_evm1s371 gene=Nk52_evmTU1s371